MEILFGNGNKPAGAAAPEGVKETTTQAFVTDVIEPSMTIPVVVEFHSPRFPQSKPVSAALEKLVKASKGAFRLARVNIDKNPDLAQQLRIETLPTVYAFHNGRPVDGFAGPLPDAQVKAFVDRLTGGAGEAPGLDEALAEAKASLAAGDVATALEIYQSILAQEPGNVPAIAGVIRSLVAANDVAQAQELLAGLPADIAKTADIAAARSAVELALQAHQAGPAAELRRAVAVNANDHQARFDLALAYFAAGEREAAIDELLEIVRRDRTWNDDGARKQLLKLIEAIGYSDPLSASARKRLSSLLFA
jgi:putative thioredoxin